MGEFFEADALLDLGAGFVAHGAKARGEVRSVLEVGRLEPHAHDRHERDFVRARRHALPKPIAHAEGTHVGAEGLDVLAIKVHVTDLVEADPEQAAPKLELGVGEGEQRPTHEFGGLELVVQEGVQGARAVQRLFERFELRGALAAARWAELARAAWCLQAHGSYVLPKVRGWRRGRELGLEIGRKHVGFGPSFDVIE